VHLVSSLENTMFGRIVDIVVRPFQPDAGEVDLAAVFAPYRRMPYAMLLLSGGDLDCASHSLMGWDPFLVVRAKGRRVQISKGEEANECVANPFTVLDDLLGALEISGPSPLAPFSAGGLGFLAYDLKNHLERLPTTAQDDLGLPDLVFAFPRRLVVHDRTAGRFWSVEIVWEDPRGRVQQSAVEPPPSGPQEAEGFRVGPLQSNFTREAYLQAVSRIKEYIRNGDVYQVNLSQRFSFPLDGDPYVLFRRLFALNPAPFYAYLNCRDFAIFSTSMERFLFRREDYLETRPIKGTRPRGCTPEEDEVQRRELEASLKDDAELSMIVDLLRNDLGKVCRARTVEVKEHKRLEAYQNVYHLVSIVTGLLSDGTTHGDILRGTFPGGSITGCPKIRSMEIIDELEPYVRHVYTGAIGYLGLHRNMDLNVAIRTAIVANGWGHFSVGGGVVYDSDEAAEYEETLHKGRTLFRLIEGENLAAASPESLEQPTAHGKTGARLDK
jgi:para-aminobenzoate synthetase component 1